MSATDHHNETIEVYKTSHNNANGARNTRGSADERPYAPLDDTVTVNPMSATGTSSAPVFDRAKTLSITMTPTSNSSKGKQQPAADFLAKSLSEERIGVGVKENGMRKTPRSPSGLEGLGNDLSMNYRRNSSSRRSVNSLLAKASDFIRRKSARKSGVGGTQNRENFADLDSNLDILGGDRSARASSSFSFTPEQLAQLRLQAPSPGHSNSNEGDRHSSGSRSLIFIDSPELTGT